MLRPRLISPGAILRLALLSDLHSGAPTVLGATQAPEPTDASVAGVVLNELTGSPLHRAQVGIHPANSTSIWALAPSGANGRFTIDGLPPGRYRLHADRSGFYSMDYGSAGPDQWGTVLVLHP